MSVSQVKFRMLENGPSLFIYTLVLLISALVAASPAWAESSYAVVPSAGQMEITLTGADGGNGGGANDDQGGTGATVTGTFTVVAGDVIRFIVGSPGVT